VGGVVVFLGEPFRSAIIDDGSSVGWVGLICVFVSVIDHRGAGDF